MKDHIKLPPLHYDELPEVDDAIPAMHNYARKAIEADRQQRSEPAVWRPIDTAPKDNKRRLYLAHLDECGRLLELDFDGTWEYWEESWEMPHINGWCWISANGIEEPTHWAYQDEELPMITHPAEPDVTGLVEARGDVIRFALSEMVKWYENISLGNNPAFQYYDLAKKALLSASTLQEQDREDALRKAVDSLVDFASTVAPSASFWDEVWPELEEAIAKALGETK